MKKPNPPPRGLPLEAASRPATSELRTPLLIAAGAVLILRALLSTITIVRSSYSAINHS